MRVLRLMMASLLLGVLGCMYQPPFAFSQTAAQRGSAPSDNSGRDGQHDFDFEIGTWKTHLRRLLKPLTGSTSWVEYDGITTVRKVWNGRANLVELIADGPAGRFEGLSLRLYNPQSRQWSLNFANINGGVITTPTIGEFKNGRGEFYNQETLNGRAILVRFVISDITPDSCHFEQAFSDDGGKTWEVNWIATDTRVKEESDKSARNSAAPKEAGPKTTSQHTIRERDGQHDFDFDIGVWKTQTSRLLKPLTGSTNWIEMEGITVVKKVWNGRANLAELEADGPTGHLTLLSLRLYDPQARQWNLNFSTPGAGTLSVPMIGEFKDGRGVFFDQESYNGKTILVRFTMWSITPDSARSEQAFSDDYGKTWETNWINRYARIKDDSE